MSGVTDLKTATGNAMTGEITLLTTQPALLGISNTPGAPYTINFAPVAGGTNTVAGKNGDVVFTAPDGCLSFTPDAISSAVKFNAYNSTSNTSGLVANNISGSLAWNTSNAYAVGAVVIDSGSTYVCLTAQPASSPAPTNGANWQSIGGGGAGGGNWSYKGAWVASNAYVVNDVVFDTNLGNGDATNIGYIASSNIPASSNAPYTTAGQTAGWLPYFNNQLVGFNNGSNASNPSYTSILSMSGLSGAPPPAGSNGGFMWAVENNDGGVYGDFGAGRFVVAGLNSGLTPSGSNTLPFITTTGNAGSNIQLSVNSGGALPVNIVGGLTVDGVPVATGGNWSYKGAFNTTVATLYALNDVVFDSVNIGDTYICILGYTTTVPTPTPPSANATNWILFATQGGASGSSLTNGGSTLSIDGTGGLLFTTTNVASNTNTISLSTTVPTTTPGASAGAITVNSGATIGLTSVNNTTIVATDPTAQLTLTAPLKINLLTSSTGSIVAGSVAASYSTGNVLFNADTWNDQAGYIKGSVVQETAGGASYVCITAVAPNTTPPYNPAPSATPADWLPLGGGGGTGNMTYTQADFTWAGSNAYAIGDIVSDTNNGVYVAKLANSNAQPSSNVADWQLIGSTNLSSGSGITGITINGGTSYPTSGSVINFIPGAGITMSNSGTDIINISASASGTGSYLTPNSNTWEWAGSNTYSATQGIVSYQGGLYANLVAPSSNVPPFGNASSATEWAGLAPGLAVGGSNVVPLANSASNAYAYSLVAGSNSNVSITSTTPGVIAFDANIGFDYPGSSGPIVGPAGLFTFQSSASNITITSPGAGLIDLNVDAPAMNYASLWTATATYEIDDVVLWGGFNWVVLVATTAGQSPFTTPASFREIGAVPTGIASAEPASMVAGNIPQNTNDGATAVNVWATSNVYMKGNVVSSDITGGMFQSTTNQNTSNDPALDTTGANWAFAGVAPQLQNNLIAYGSNAPGVLSGVVTTPNNGKAELYDFLQVMTALTPNLGNAGGCHMTYNGTGTISYSGGSNAEDLVGVQLFDSGTSNVVSYSAPYYFPTPYPIGNSGSGSATFPINASIITPVNSNATQTYSLAILFGNTQSPSGGLNGVASSLTGACSYLFSPQTTNLSL